ncbi:hypothetical protein U1Q18_034130 [Sarracenia purpurea var. burkii]
MAKNKFKIPIIDLVGVGEDQIRRKEVIGEIRATMETGGFFQLINHGIPGRVLKEALDGTRRFFEQNVDVRKGVVHARPQESFCALHQFRFL